MKKFRILFALCLIAAAVGTLSLFLIMFSSGFSTEENRSLFHRILGIVFWASFVIELILFYNVDLQRKIISVIEGYSIEYGKAGIFSFKKNKFGKTADAVMIISVILFLILMIMNSHARSAVVLCTGSLYLSTVMHCICNGKNFRFLCDHRIKEN